MLSIDLTHPNLSILSGHLNMGGKDPHGRAIDANSRYLTFDGQPWLPVMGEFHFSRYPQSGWKQELRKMKAGGIHIAATYIFWIHHEEDEMDFEGAEVWQVSLPEEILEQAQEAFLQVDYTGDVGRAYLGDRLIADDFYFGRTWEIGLRRFAPELFQGALTLRFLPLRKDAPIYLPPDRWPDFGTAQEIIQVRSIGVRVEYGIKISRGGS